jgi:hypothetical protein
MAQRTLHAIINVYYRSTSCFATDSLAKGPAGSAKDFLAKGPSCNMWFGHIIKYVTCMIERMMHIPTQPSEAHNL